MTLPAKPESTPEQPIPELPIPTIGSASADKPTSGVDTKALAKEVAELLRPEIGKTVQSTKDRRIARIERTLGISELEELQEMGATIPENVAMEYRLRQLEGSKQTPQTPPQTPTSPGSGATLTGAEVAQVVKEYGLDANSADVIEALRGTYRNRDHFESTMAKLALGKTNRPQPSPAASTTLKAPPPPEAKLSEQEADQKYSEIAVLLRNPSLNGAKILNLQKELREAGYAVD